MYAHRSLLAVLSVAAVASAGCVDLFAHAPAPVATRPDPTLLVFTSVRVDHGGFEPRVAVGPDGTHWISTQDTTGAEVVYSSPDGVHWTKTPSDPQVSQPCCDNEIAVTPAGRVLTSIISGGLGTTSLDIHYSDDGGKTWTASQGNAVADQDRQWLAVGAKDPGTGQYDVYMLWHNLLSGAANHEMFVSTSRDGGATFGAPVPVTPPGSPAWLDLQCADSGGPSNIFANPRTGQVYAVFGTRSSAVGGCGASVTGAFEINVVAATRVWVATSTDQGATWTDSLAVDDSAAGNIVGMQVNAGTIDNQGNVYVVYPESPQPYPNYEGAAVRYKWAPADLGHWSPALTVEPPVEGGNKAGAGHLLAHMAAGDPGKLAFFYLTGSGNGSESYWYPTVSQTVNGLDATPAFVHPYVSGLAAWKGTASALMGVCNPLGPQPFPASDVNALLNGFACARSSDVLGQAIDLSCHATFVWYDSGQVEKSTSGTYVTSQTSGPSLCTPASAPAR